MGFSSNEDSGRLRLDGGFVCYESKMYGSWRLQIADIRVIGEATNQNGPSVDDYLICIVTDSSGCWDEATFYADGRDDCLEALGAVLGTNLELKLCTSTDFVSHILWPHHLIGKPMFKCTDKVPRGVWQWLRSRICPQVVQTLSDVALAELPPAGTRTDREDDVQRGE